MHDVINKALQFAYNSHEGQSDKAGEPYILHPVAVSMSDWVLTTTQKVIALLHDVVEDCGVTTEELVENGFSQAVIDALDLLTHKSNDEYFTYINRIATSGNRNAICVKLADLEHNSMLSRIKHPTTKDYKRVEKYQAATEILSLAFQKLYGV